MQPHDNKEDLTHDEATALNFKFNLADAHTHQNQSHSQEKIIKRLPDIFFEAQETKQPILNKRTIQAYHNLAYQHTVVDLDRSLLCYSASTSMEIVANYVRARQLSVALIEPTFDNIANILKRHNIPLEAFDDQLLRDDDFDRFIASTDANVLFLTLPNNPTGTFLFPDQFERLVRCCVLRNKLLILDTCFRLYEPSFCYDQYKILEEAGIEYIVIEDTGKLWPALDLKVSFLNCSKSLQLPLQNIHSDFLLNVSPFILRLLLEYFKDSAEDNFQSIRGLIQKNRDYLRSQIKDTILQPVNEQTNVSVELLQITNAVSAKKLKTYLDAHEIMILTGDKFFWNQPALGESLIRIALARSYDHFRRSIDAMVEKLMIMNR